MFIEELPYEIVKDFYRHQVSNKRKKKNHVVMNTPLLLDILEGKTAKVDLCGGGVEVFKPLYNAMLSRGYQLRVHNHPLKEGYVLVWLDNIKTGPKLKCSCNHPTKIRCQDD